MHKNEIHFTSDILVFGTMGTIAQDISGSLLSHGLNTVYVPFEQNVFNDEPGYRRALAKAIGTFRPKAVFPVGHPLAMSRFKKLIGHGVPLNEIINGRKHEPQLEEAVRNAILIVESEEKIRMLDSKVQFYALAKSLGLRQPALFRDADVTPENIKVVFKRDISFGGHGVHQPRSKEALDNLIVHQSRGEPYLIEEFIDGDDYSLDAVRFREPPQHETATDKMLTACKGSMYCGGYRCIKSKGNGPAERREPLDRNDPILAQMKSYAETVLEHLDYHGICGFDFRADNSGQIFLIECNPRFTGGISTQLASGFDLPWLLYRSIMPVER